MSSPKGKTLARAVTHFRAVHVIKKKKGFFIVFLFFYSEVIVGNSASCLDLHSHLCERSERSRAPGVQEAPV